MDVTLFGIATVVRLAHFSKVPPSMVTKLPGRVTEDRLVQSAKAYPPMDVTLLGIETEVSPQPSKALPPIVTTLSGMDIDSRQVQLEKADAPIVVTQSGIETKVSPEHRLKA